MRYAIVIENAGPNYSAYAPDVPGCIATGETIDDARANIKSAIKMHLAGLQEDRDQIPEP